MTAKQPTPQPIGAKRPKAPKGPPPRRYKSYFGIEILMDQPKSDVERTPEMDSEIKKAIDSLMAFARSRKK